jgi:hypothetical protein
MLYVKENELSNYPKLKEARDHGHDKAIALVHPHIYTYYESRWNKIAPLIWKVPLPIIKFGKRVLKKKG